MQERDGAIRPARAAGRGRADPDAHRPQRHRGRAARGGRPLPGGGRQPRLPHPGAARPDQLPDGDRRPRRRGGRGGRAAQRRLRLLGRGARRAPPRRPALQLPGARPSTTGPARWPRRCAACAPTTGSATTARWPRWSSGSWPSAAWWRWAWSTGAAATPSGAPGSWSSRRAPSRPTARRDCGAFTAWLEERTGGADPRARRGRPGRRRGRRPHPHRARRQGARVPDRDHGGHRAQSPERRAADGLARRRGRAGHHRRHQGTRASSPWATWPRSRSGRGPTARPRRRGSSTWAPPAPATT